jgi:hypothetical protein
VPEDADDDAETDYADESRGRYFDGVGEATRGAPTKTLAESLRVRPSVD